MSGQQSRIAAFLGGLIPLVVAGVVVFVLFVVGDKAVQGYELRREARALEQRIDQLKREHRRLSEELDYYRGDAYIEKVAREELGLVRPGDVAVVVLLSEERPSVSPAPLPAGWATATPARPETPAWQRWLSLFVDQE